MNKTIQLNKSIKKKKKTKWKRGMFITGLLALSVSHFLIFWVYMNFETVRMTFFEYKKHKAALEFVGFDGYVKLFKEFFIFEGHESNLNIFLNTFRAIIINLIIFPLALYTAYAFYKKVYGEKFFRVIFYLPSVISLVALTMAYRNMFDGNVSGPIAVLFKKLGADTNKWLETSPHNTQLWPIIYIFCVLMGLGTNVILMSGAMLRIPQDIPEALQIDGCSYFREMFSVTIPLIMPTITTWGIAIFTSVFGFMMQPMLIAKDAGYENMFMTLPWWMFNAVQSGDKASQYKAATAGIMFSAFMMPIILVIRYVLEKVTPDVDF